MGWCPGLIRGIPYWCGQQLSIFKVRIILGKLCPKSLWLKCKKIYIKEVGCLYFAFSIQPWLWIPAGSEGKSMWVGWGGGGDKEKKWKVRTDKSKLCIEKRSQFSNKITFSCQAHYVRISLTFIKRYHGKRNFLVFSTFWSYCSL